MNSNQEQPQNTGSENIGATLQVATVITTSDQLIAEDIEGKTLFSEPEQLGLDVGQAEFIQRASDDEPSEADDTSATKQIGPSVLSTGALKSGIVAIAPGALTVKSPQMNIERSGSSGSVASGNTQTLSGKAQSDIAESAEEDVDEDELKDQALTETIEAETIQESQEEVLAEPDVEPLQEAAQMITATEISALDTLSENASNELPAMELPIIEVVEVNNPPIAEPTIVTANEDSRYYFSVSDFGYSDSDGDPWVGVIISQLPQQGKLLLNDVNVSDNQTISVVDLKGLSFTPPSDQHGSYGFGFKVTDGDLESQEYTLTLNITPVADVPLLVTGSSSQVFLTDFQKGADGWQTDNPSGYLELNPETAYGGDDVSNRVLEVEAAIGDNNLYRVIPTEQGQNYQLNVEFSSRQGFPDSTIDVLWGGGVVATLDGSSGTFGWGTHSLALSGDGTDKRLEFQSTDSNGVGGLLDNIELIELYAAGLEDQPVSISVKASLMDADSSEQLSLMVSELPQGSVLSDGNQVFIASERGNAADISEWNTDRLTIIPPENFYGMFDIVYTATATERSTEQSYSTSEQLTINVIKEPLGSGDLFSGSEDEKVPVASISNSQLIVSESDLMSAILEGRILSNDGFSSIEHWHLFHKGGALDIAAKAPEGEQWLSSFRLFDISAGNQAGGQVESVDTDITGLAMQPVLSLDNLPAGYYMLAVGNEGFTEADAFSLLDYANSSSGSQDYQLEVTGNSELHYLPVNTESYGQIQSQTYSSAEVQVQIIVELNTESAFHGLNYYFELMNGNDFLSQESVSFPSGENSLESTITINNKILDSVNALDDIQAKLYGVDSSGVIQVSQTFQLASGQNPAEDYVALVDSEPTEGMEFLDAGLGLYELVFSELMEDVQNPLPG